jgi:hypothetical protein
MKRLNFALIFVVAIFALILSACLAAIPAPVNDAFAQVWLFLGGLFGKALFTLLCLVLLDVITGVAAAVKAGVFQWAKVLDFYQKTILPLILGWVAITLFLNYASSDLLGQGSDALTIPTAATLWALTVRQIGASVLDNVQCIIGQKEKDAQA